MSAMNRMVVFFAFNLTCISVLDCLPARPLNTCSTLRVCGSNGCEYECEYGYEHSKGHNLVQARFSEKSIVCIESRREDTQ